MQFFEDKISKMKRDNSGLLRGNFNEVMSPEEAAEQGIEHNVLTDF